MTRPLTAAVAAWLVLFGTAAAAESSFSTPAEAREVVQADDATVALRYDPTAWAIESRPSKFRMFAIATHQEPKVSGTLVYRAGASTEQEVRERAIAELEMFKDHEADFSRRTVNGVSVLFMKATATKANGENMEVRSYYWMSPDGVVDYAVMAPREQFVRHRDAVMGLLNGLEITEARTAY